MLKGVILSSLDIIKTPGGDVMHAMKNSSSGYSGFGEAYFSKIDSGAIKGWKRHKKMTLNLIVPEGKVRFILYDDSSSNFQEIIISKKNFCRLTIPPMLWMAFQGLSEGCSLVLNIADIEHNPLEVDKKNLEQINFDWES